MANYAQFDLPMLEVPEGREACLTEVLKCILHTILFHRALGSVRPVDGCVNDLDLDYVYCDDEEVKKTVNHLIDEYTQRRKKEGPELSKFVLLINERTGNGYEVMEKWSISFVLRRSDDLDRTKEQLLSILMRIVYDANEKVDYLPAIPKVSPSPLLFKYTLEEKKTSVWPSIFGLFG